MDELKRKVLLKLRQPIHYTYISKYILESSEESTLKYLSQLAEEGYIKETKFKGYFEAI
jgi:hypothetical protein